MHNTVNNRLGKIYGTLSVMQDSGTRNTNGEVIWELVCSECSTIAHMDIRRIRTRTKSMEAGTIHSMCPTCHQEVIDNMKPYRKAYRSAKYGAARRGVVWELTFVEFKQIWDESGLWHKRGAGIGQYCMQRGKKLGMPDSGWYEVDNVEIGTTTKNKKDTIKWTKEMCMESASKYTVKYNWKSGDYAAHNAARRHGWYDECTKHMIPDARYN